MDIPKVSNCSSGLLSSIPKILCTGVVEGTLASETTSIEFFSASSLADDQEFIEREENSGSLCSNISENGSVSEYGSPTESFDDSGSIYIDEETASDIVSESENNDGLWDRR